MARSQSAGQSRSMGTSPGQTRPGSERLFAWFAGGDLAFPSAKPGVGPPIRLTDPDHLYPRDASCSTSPTAGRQAPVRQAGRGGDACGDGGLDRRASGRAVHIRHRQARVHKDSSSGRAMPCQTPRPRPGSRSLTAREPHLKSPTRQVALRSGYGLASPSVLGSLGTSAPSCRPNFQRGCPSSPLSRTNSGGDRLR